MARPRKGIRGRADRRELLSEVDSAQNEDAQPSAFEHGEGLVAKHMKKLAAVSNALDAALAAKRPDVDRVNMLNERMLSLCKAATGLSALQSAITKVAKVRSEIRVDQSPDRIELVGVEAMDAILEGRSPLPSDRERGPVH